MKGPGSTRGSRSNNPRGLVSNGSSWSRSNPYEQTPIEYLRGMASDLKKSTNAEESHVESNPNEWNRRNGNRDVIVLSYDGGKAYGDSYTDTVIVREGSAENYTYSRGTRTSGPVPREYSSDVKRVQDYIKKKKYDGAVYLRFDYD